jgi:pSer/pThr/pTyr-binding forkhead associated (FHA) protein
MAALEVLSPGGQDYRELEADRVTVGRSADNDLVIHDDSSVSRHHAMLERIGSGWFIRDLDSSNGTDVNGDRLIGERALRQGDEILVGRTRLVFHDRSVASDPSTSKRDPKPRVTPKEREVLVELCRPVLLGSAFRAPAKVREIADRMFVGEAAVKAHLSRLYDKFGIYSEGGDRRLELANRAIETGTVTRRDLIAGDGDNEVS